jgi:hypothetical protein
LVDFFGFYWVGSLLPTLLPGHVRNEYFHLVRISRSIMDYQTEILAEVPAFLTALESNHDAPQAKSDDDMLSR